MTAPQRARGIAANPRAAPPALIAETPRETDSSIAADERTVSELKKAERLYAIFLERADDEPRYREAVARARERLVDLREEIAFIEAGIAEKQHQQTTR